jgi:hypothetical protein
VPTKYGIASDSPENVPVVERLKDRERVTPPESGSDVSIADGPGIVLMIW